MSTSLRFRAIALIVAFGVGCAWSAPAGGDQGMCEERVWHLEHVSVALPCERDAAARVVATVWWLRWYGFWRAAAIYATAAHQAGSIHDHPWLACIRARESGGNYRIYNAQGSGASGAYQFMPQTWAWMSAEAGYGAWSGGPAASAPPYVQDAVALWAYEHGYASHWAATNGGC